MTSKISFSKLVRNEMRQMTWLTAIWGLLFGLLIPFRVLMVMAVRYANSDAGRYLIAENFYAQVGLGQLANVVFILIAGATCALCAFSYLHSAVKLDLYHSLALGRERLFAARYVSSALTFGIAYLVCQLLAILIGVFYRVFSWHLLFEMAVASLQGILIFLCSYSAVLLAIMLTGKMLTTIFAVGVFGGYIPLVCLMVIGLRSIFMTTGLGESYYDVIEPGILKCSSPWAFSITQALEGKKQGITGMIPSLGSLCQLLALAAFLTAVSLILYRIRKTEAAGSALAFQKTEGVIKLMLCVPVAILAAMIANELFESVVWEIIFMILFGTLACMIMEFIYRWDIQQVLQKKGHMAATILIAAVVFFPIRMDVLGYNTYLPEKEDLAAMAVRDIHLNIRYPGVTGSDRYSGRYARQVLDYLETEEFDGLYRLAECGVDHVRNHAWTGNVTYISLKFRTKRGKETYRTYEVEEELFLEVMDELIQKQGLRELYFPILTWNGEDIQRNVIQAGLYQTGDMEEDQVSSYSPDDYSYIEVPLEDRERVVKAYCEDLQNISWEDIWLAKSYLRFMTDQVSWMTEQYPLTESFENTLAVLKEIRRKAEE